MNQVCLLTLAARLARQCEARTLLIGATGLASEPVHMN